MAPMAEVRIRRAAPTDLPAIVDRWRELMAVHTALHSALYALAPHAAETYAATVRRQMSDVSCVVLVAEGAAAEPGGRAATLDGYLTGGVGLRAPIYAHREVGMIFDVSVRPDCQRNGVGTALLATVDAWFTRKGLDFIQVDFAPGNALSEAFWRKNGFEVLLSEAYRVPRCDPPLGNRI